MEKKNKRLEIKVLDSEIRKVQEEIQKLRIKGIELQLRKARLEGKRLRNAVTPIY